MGQDCREGALGRAEGRAWPREGRAEPPSVLTPAPRQRGIPAGTPLPAGQEELRRGPDRSGGAGKRGEGTPQRGSRARLVHRPSPPRGSARVAAAACAAQSQAASRNRAAASPPLSESEPVSLSGPEPPLGAAILQARDTVGAVVQPRCMPGGVVRLHSTPGAVVRHSLPISEFHKLIHVLISIWRIRFIPFGPC